MNLIRYINGVKVEDKDICNYVIESEVISQVIKTVNERLQKNFTKS